MASDLPAKLLEEKLLRALRARRRFKAAARHVIHNLYWLVDDEGLPDLDQLDGDNIKRNLTRLTKKQPKTGVLTIKEKGILRKHTDFRTEEEKILINKYLSGLKCFRRYPEDVTFKLVSVSYFEYFGPDRVLVKQNHDSFAMYFILTGEVVITKEVYDEIEKKWTTQEMGKIMAGNMFGEVSLLHDAKRTATVTTTSPCELLVLKKDDFNNVLKATIKARWNEIRDAMYKFSYFDNWDDFSIRECCILSKIKSYEPNQVILGDGIGKSSQVMVYFVIEGTCALIEHLYVIETVKRGIKKYALYVPPEDESDDVVEEQTKYIKFDDLLEDTEVEEYEDENEEYESAMGEHSYTNQLREEQEEEEEEEEEESGGSADADEPVYPTIEEIRNIGRKERKFTIDQQKKNKKESKNYVEKLLPNVKLRFMQVCTFGEKSSFMNNKILEYRRVIALTPVKCILVPAYWLGQHNKGNVWTRVAQFLKWRVPTRNQVFRNYVSNKKWNEYKKKMVYDILRDKKLGNSTTIHDVPYSIRVKSEID